MRTSSRLRVKCQTQERLRDKYSYCGLYSVNNSLQAVDFLTPQKMKRGLARLAKVESNVDHDHVRYGAYTTQALHLALQKVGKQLRYLNRPISGFKKKSLRSQLIVASPQASLLIILGRRPGQVDGTWHCIARAKVADKFHFIDSDEYLILPNQPKVLDNFFEHIDGAYAIEDIPTNRVKAKK